MTSYLFGRPVELTTVAPESTNLPREGYTRVVGRIGGCIVTETLLPALDPRMDMPPSAVVDTAHWARDVYDAADVASGLVPDDDDPPRPLLRGHAHVAAILDDIAWSRDPCNAAVTPRSRTSIDDLQ